MGVLFGLAMDYQVFLVSRMREEWSRRRGDATDATPEARREAAAVACLNEVVAGELREFYVEGAAVVGGVSGCLWGGAVGHSSSLNGACGLTLFVFSGAEVSVGLVCPDMQSENGRNASGRKLLQPRGP